MQSKNNKNPSDKTIILMRAICTEGTNFKKQIIMLVGTDVNIDVCKNEGYLYVNFNTKVFKKDKKYRVMRKFPIWDELKGQYQTDTFVSWDDVLEQYLDDKQGIDDFAETNKYINFEQPTIDDFVNLCSDVSSYKGIY